MFPANGVPAPPPSADGSSPCAPAPEAESEVDAFRRQVDDLFSKTDRLERQVNEVVDFYDSKKHGSGGRKAGGGVYGGRGPADLFRQFGVILREAIFLLSSYELARPFQQPVDALALELPDYHQIISKPIDFSTIQNKMEGKEYNNVREICSDVRLIFSNAMKYNAEGHAVHKMAKKLLDMFEEKWLRLLPKVESEEKRQKEEESLDIIGANTSPEAATAKLAKKTDDELSEINKQLEELREMVVQRCRKMTTDEKRKLGAGLCHLSPYDLSKALEIVAQDNPNFQTKAEDVDLDMDAQNYKARRLHGHESFCVSFFGYFFLCFFFNCASYARAESETTLWRLKFFVREALEREANVVSGKMDENAKRKSETFSDRPNYFDVDNYFCYFQKGKSKFLECQ